jgi:hypothetical protein
MGHSFYNQSILLPINVAINYRLHCSGLWHQQWIVALVSKHAELARVIGLFTLIDLAKLHPFRKNYILLYIAVCKIRSVFFFSSWYNFITKSYPIWDVLLMILSFMGPPRKKSTHLPRVHMHQHISAMTWSQGKMINTCQISSIAERRRSGEYWLWV